MNLLSLKNFLILANQAGYASGEDKKWVKEPDGSTSIHYENSEWKMHDNFFGGEPYGGRIIVFKNQKPFWMMVYYGWVEDGTPTKEVYSVLQGALRLMPKDSPFRGPREFISDKFIYNNSWSGEVDRYSGEESISSNGKVIYKANYLGGLVDQLNN